MCIIKPFLGTVSLSETARDQVGQGRKVLAQAQIAVGRRKDVCAYVLLHVNTVTGNATTAQLDLYE
jgi:hypothetical protein